MRVHSVLRGWMQFNSPDPKTVEKTLEDARVSLRAAKAYGSDAILLVPCRIDGKNMPPIGDIDIDFDESNGHLKRIVKGDNAPYAEYIKLHDHAADTSRAAVEKLIPLAEELKIVIGLENVWNNLWVKPAIYKHFVASFKSPWVQAYFDIGNHVKYAPPQEWIKTLGSLLIKLHMKDFDLASKKFVQLRNGSVDWPAVRQALDEAGYNGWGTIEGGSLALEELNARFDLIIAGK
jgi:hexulose-6-phosphate isomerase